MSYNYNKYNNYEEQLNDPNRDKREKLINIIGPEIVEHFSDSYVFPDNLFREIRIAKERFDPMTWEIIYIDDDGSNFNYFGKNPIIKKFVEDYKLQNIKKVSMLENKAPYGVLNKIASFLSGEKGTINEQLEKSREKLKQAGGKRKTKHRKNIKKSKMSKKNNKK
jgi:hypothetical protein